MSERVSASLPPSCSGDMYGKVPIRVPSFVSGLLAVGRLWWDAWPSRISPKDRCGCMAFARPKSSSFAPDSVSMILPGLRSR